MSTEANVSSGETIYRQFSIRNDPPRQPWFASGQPPVPPGFFNPSPKDTDGLSVICASQRHPYWAARRYDPSQADDGLDEAFRLGCVDADGATHEGMTLRLDRDALDQDRDTDAHAVIVEMSINHKNGREGKDAKEQFRKYRDLLRMTLCQQVIGPFPRPDTSNTPILPEVL